jgi:carboxylesterase
VPTTIQKGAEPFYYPGNEPGCLLLHGFTATPQEVHELGAHLANQGFAVLGVRIFAHGTTLEDMARSRRWDWIASVEDGYYLLRNSCKRIIPIGLSLGGILTIMISHRFPLEGFVAMSTPNRLPPLPIYQTFRPVLKPLSRYYRFHSKGRGNWYDPNGGIERVAYDAYPLRSIVELELLLAEMRSLLPEIHIPGLFIHSKTDDFVPHSHMIDNYNLLGSTDKRMKSIDLSNHIITCDISREEVFSSVTSFVQEITGSRQ